MLLLMSFMLQIWMKLMVLMLLMMSNLTIMTIMMILMMIRPGEGGTFCWLASQPAGRTLHTLRTFRKEQNSLKKVWPPPLFVIFYPASRNQAEKFIYQFFKAQVTGKSIYFCEYTFFYFFEKRVKLEK